MSDQLPNTINVLEAHELSKQVSSPEGTLTILSDVSFVISAGESVAVVGPSGAGKSTLLALLAGLDLPTNGYVMLNAANLALVAFSKYLNIIDVQVFVFLVMVVAAVEVAVGLALIIAIFRLRETINVDEMNLMTW